MFHSQPSDSKEPNDRGIGCQLTAARRRAWPGHAPTGTARGYPVSCADMLIHPQGKHSQKQGIKEKTVNSYQTKGLHKAPESDFKKKKKDNIEIFSFPQVKRI